MAIKFTVREPEKFLYLLVNSLFREIPEKYFGLNSPSLGHELARADNRRKAKHVYNFLQGQFYY
jgi:hypothetical protein